MGRSQGVILLATALCFLSLAGLSYAAETTFNVQGYVYCDTCRLQFITRVSQMIPGATVRLECRNITTNSQSFSAEAVTDKTGFYSIPVDGDKDDDICEIILVKSPREDCNEIPKDIYTQQSAKISLTSNNGEATPVRFANPLGFMMKNTLKECPEVVKELDLTSPDS